MTPEELLLQLVSAHRERSPSGEVRFAPAFHDLSPSEREEAFRLTTAQRFLEAALDSQGLSTTAHAVLDRIRKANP